MKGLKKLLTGILAGAMAVTMALSAGGATQVQAADNGSITVSNTTKDKEYKLYKVFDATYSGSNVAYTYTAKGENDAFLAALQAETSPFTVVSNGSSYNVVRKKDTKDDAVIDFIEANGPARNEDGTWTTGNFGAAVATLTGNGGSIKFENLDYGYYYITSSLGAFVTIDSALKDATVIDKNQGSTLDKQEKVANGTWEYQGAFDETATVPTAKVGDKVEYRLVGTLTKFVGEEEVDHFTFTDTMTTGLTRNEDVVVKLNNADVTANVSVTTQGQTLTIVVPKTVLTESSMTYEITYSAVINENAVVTTEQENDADLKYNDNNDIDSDKTKVKNYKITLTKTDEQGNVLADAWFKLYTTQDINDKRTNIPVVLVANDKVEKYGTAESPVDNVYRVAKTGEEAVEMITGTTGKIVVEGLNNGSYYFEETKAPNGYNMLTARTEVTTIENADGTITVLNKTGLELPATGGIGTTIFYIVGGILIVAGVAYFMLRRKADAE